MHAATAVSQHGDPPSHAPAKKHLNECPAQTHGPVASGYSPGPNNSPRNRWSVPVSAGEPNKEKEQPSGTLHSMTRLRPGLTD